MNASNRDADFAWLKEREISGSDVRDVSDEYALLAVQGPNAIAKLGLRAGAGVHVRRGGDRRHRGCMVNRTGYTGEDGCELLCMAEDAGALWDAVLARGVTPCGLGARDTLRLEACYPLHGNDIAPETDRDLRRPRLDVRARRRTSPASTCCAAIKEDGPERRLVAFVMEEKAIPRQGMPIEGGGEVTSGTHSPMLDVGIGMGYVPTAHAKPGTELTIDVRGKPRKARVVKKPIYKREG